MNRDAFLARVEQAATAGRKYRLHVPDVPSQAGYVGAAGDLCDALAAEVTFVGGEALVLETWSDARDAVLQLLRHYQVRTALCWQHATLERLGLSDLLAAESIASQSYEQLATYSPVVRRSTILAADVGISSTDFAIAETGTLAVRSQPGQERVITLAVPIHIAIVSKEQILPDLFDLFAKLQELGYENLPSNLAMISGPSKTGDIELELTTGIHGPGKWHVLIVREPATS